jgi:broad specificity phosphatase PhoE
MMLTDRLRLYVVRHGVTAWNRELRMQGHTDVPLDAGGQQQAQRIGARLRAVPHAPQAVWSSDLRRARDTAGAIAQALDLPVRTTPLLRETMLGEWEGLTRPEIEARGDSELLANYLRDSHRFRPPGSESLEDVWDRLQRAAELIRTEHPIGQVAVVGHGGSLRALLCSALDAPVESMRRLWLDNASLSIIEELHDARGRYARVTLINDTSHLYDPSHSHHGA